jgi:hypothetical protein
MLLQKERFLAGNAGEPPPRAAGEDFDPETGTAPSQAPGMAGRKPQPLSLFGERLQSALHKPKEGV